MVIESAHITIKYFLKDHAFPMKHGPLVTTGLWSPTKNLPLHAPVAGETGVKLWREEWSYREAAANLFVFNCFWGEFHSP